MDTEEPREQLWHRLDRESGRAYQAFKVYAAVPPAERTVVGAWRLWSDNPDAKREPPFFLRWSHTYAWSERARAYDHHIEVIRESGMEEAIREEAARQARQVEQVRGRFNELMAITYERAIEYLEDEDFLKQLRPADVVQILKIHLETTQKLGDTNTQTPDSGVDWSEDEQRELDRILDEIESEEAQEEPEEGSEVSEEGSEESEDDQDK